MIHASFHCDTNQRITAFELTGHADSGPYGQDIVCAAVSALSISTVNGLEELVQAQPNVESDNANGGYLRVTNLGTDHDSQLLLKTLRNSLLDIQESYPHNVDIKILK